MNREITLQYVKDNPDVWDFAIIGGGATGLGVAVDAASRGYKTLLLEQGDFAQGTSSRSTKLIHGGVRYLQQGNISLVVEALKERGLLRKNASHLVHDLEFIIPNYDWWESPFYGIGLKMYDVLAGKLGLGPSKFLSKDETLKILPTIEPEGLKGGVKYHDGQFDDARLAINLAQTAVDHGGSLLNYVQVTGLIKESGFVEGLELKDTENGDHLNIKARVVVNATGAFTDGVLSMDENQPEKLVQPSQGIHLVMDRSFLESDTAVMIPHTDDGRVLFAVPWHDRILLGTTDEAVEEPTLEPRATDREIDYLLEHIARYLTRDPQRSDVLSVFAGLRPLVRKPGAGSTSEISRDHALFVSNSGLVTIAGGKWTTYRKMAEDAVDMGINVGELEEKACITEDLQIHGSYDERYLHSYLGVYGTDAKIIQDIIDEDSSFKEQAHPNLPFRVGEIVWAVRHEMARTVTDVLSRRTRSILLNARASVEVAPMVASVMAKELDKDAEWEKRQVEDFTSVADAYIVKY